MTPDEFRRIAVGLAGALEASHMGHPDFRVNGRVFATLGYPNAAWAMVKLTPEEQRDFVRAHPAVFQPVNGAWGRQGATNIRLEAATGEAAGGALTAAWRSASARPPAAKRKKPSRRPL
jgi:hypothetical protein